MLHHFRGQFADLVARKRGLEAKRRASGQVDRNPRLAFVHRQQEPVTPDTVLVAERLAQGCAEADCDVLHGMVFIHLEVPAAGKFESESAVLGDLLEHVVEKADAGRDRRVTRRVEIDCRLDTRFGRVPRDRGRALGVT